MTDLKKIAAVLREDAGEITTYFCPCPISDCPNMKSAHLPVCSDHLLAAADACEAAAKLPRTADHIYDALLSYRCLHYHVDDEESGASLLDLLAAAFDDETVENAKDELGELAAHISDELEAAARTAKGAENAADKPE